VEPARRIGVAGPGRAPRPPEESAIIGAAFGYVVAGGRYLARTFALLAQVPRAGIGSVLVVFGMVARGRIAAAGLSR